MLEHPCGGCLNSNAAGRIMRTRMTIMAILVVWLLPARALDPHKQITQYVHHTWTSKNGLPENDVKGVVQTEDGYLWLATENGVVRFDGMSFTVFDHRNTPVMGDDYVSTLLVEGKDLWIRTTSAVLRYKNKEFIRVMAQDGLPEGRTKELWRDFEGNLRVKTAAGTAVWKNGKFRSDTSPAYKSGMDVRETLRDRQGNIWLASNAGLGLLRHGRITVYTKKNGLSDDRIGAILEDRAGNLWIGTHSGLNRWRDGVITKYPLSRKWTNPKIHCLREDKDGNLWVGTEVGLFRVNPEGVTGYSTDRD